MTIFEIGANIFVDIQILSSYLTHSEEGCSHGEHYGHVLFIATIDKHVPFVESMPQRVSFLITPGLFVKEDGIRIDHLSIGFAN